MLGLPILDANGRPDQPRTKAIRARALERGLITWECGTDGHVIGLVPPLTVTKAEIAEAADILTEAVRQAR
jgi:4-aminobutyrate aminotransferase/(S)-3-amino-2-methylpropionate transaminase